MPPMEDRRRPELAGAALAALTFAAALACGRLLVGHGWVVPALIAACLPHVIGLLTRRRGWKPIATIAVSLGALLLFCAWRFAGDTTIAGIPTWHTLEVLWDQVTSGFRAIRQEVAPVLVTSNVLLLVVIGTWIAGTLADYLAFERDATAGALMPPLVLVVVAAAIGDRIEPGSTAFVFASAAAAFLLLRHDSLLRRRRRWVEGSSAPSTNSALRAGAIVGAIAVLTGVVLAPHLPLSGGGPVVDHWFAGQAAPKDATSSSDTGYVTISPLVTIRKSLLEQKPREVFTVRSDIRSYWRVAGLDRFDGKTWSLQSTSEDLTAVAPQGPSVGPFRQTFKIGELGDRFLPVAFQAMAIGPAGTGPKYTIDYSTDTVLLNGRDSVSGLTYDVTSYFPPNPASVPPALLDATADKEIPQVLDRFLREPVLPDLVRRTADLAVRGAVTPYEKAVALERYFTDGRFTYSLTSAPAGSGENDMVQFLRTRTGYCEQFAGTFAAMARYLGIPARVAVGFTPGVQDPKNPNLWRVSTSDAHAWPELYLPGLGWWPFEPTPSSPGAGGSEFVARPALVTNADGTVAPIELPEAAPQDAADLGVDTSAPEITASGDGSRSGLHPDRFVVPGIVVLLIAAIVGYLIGVPFAKRRRRRRRRDAPDPRDAVAGAWAEAVERLEEAGVSPRPTATPRETASAVGRRGMAHVASPLSALAEEWTVAAFGAEPPSKADVDAAWASFAELENALDEDLGTSQRWRRALDPTPLLRRG